MKIAYILLCHKNSKQINALISELLKDGSDCYIHIDRKVELNIMTSEHVFILPDALRVNVQWAGNSMVRATLNLINYVCTNNKQYEYVCLLSGQDLPVKRAVDRIDFLTKNKGRNFIEVLSHDNFLYKRYSKRNAVYYPEFLYKRTKLSKALRKLYIYITGGYNYTFKLFQRQNSTGINFEYGSQWWCLTFDFIKWINEYVKKSDIIDFFDHSLTPDECFFQSLLMSSSFKNTQHERLMFSEWAENQNNPRPIEMSDVERLFTEKAILFARKFDAMVDQETFNEVISKLNS